MLSSVKEGVTRRDSTSVQASRNARWAWEFGLPPNLTASRDRCILTGACRSKKLRMAHATSLKRLSSVSAAAALLGIGAAAESQNLARVNQDELASFYGRMNVVVGSGARAFGMGGAFLARADDATAASWNPAGLSYLRRTEVSLVGAHNDFSQKIPRSNDSVDPPTNVTSLDQLRGSVADFVGFAYPLRVRDKTGAIQVSYQRSFSFTGSRRSEGAGGLLPSGQRTPEFTVEGKGGFDSLSLSSGFEIHPRLRVGVSVNRWINGFSQQVFRPERQIDSRWEIDGTNFNLGVLFVPVPKLNLGAVLKTPFGAPVRLTKFRTDLGTTPDSITNRVSGPSFNKGEGDVRIRFPRVYGLGASYRATNTITLSTDFTRTAWSQATITSFFSLPHGDVQPSIDRYGELPFPAVEEGRDSQRDTNQFRMGAEWVLRLGPSGSVLLPLRAGFFRDGQPVIIRLTRPDESPLPDVKPSFSGYTAGVGVTVGGVLFDVAYIREGGNVPADRNRDKIANATREIRYSRLFASMMVRFGPRR